MKTLILTAKAEDSGTRLDAWISARAPEISRSRAVKIIEQGMVAVDGSRPKKNHRLLGGERVEIVVPEAREIEARPEQIPLEIVYEDEFLLVINKPRGMVVHPAPGSPDGTLVNALLAHCALSGIGGAVRPGIVHRLDKDTSGLLVAAKCDSAHAGLSEQLKSRTLTRVYQAVVRGNIKENTGIIDLPIGRSPRERKKMAVTPGGRPSLTEYTVLARANGYTHVRCKLRTGRTHQIRVHFAHMGHPVAGDPVYGGRGDKSGLSGQCLHAKVLEFTHPQTGERMSFECPLPEYFTQLLSKTGLVEQ